MLFLSYYTVPVELQRLTNQTTVYHWIKFKLQQIITDIEILTTFRYSTQSFTASLTHMAKMLLETIISVSFPSKAKLNHFG